MLTSDNYNKRVDEVHYFRIGKMTTLEYVSDENLRKAPMMQFVLAATSAA